MHYEKHREAFGEHTGISAHCSDGINHIVNNDPDFDTFRLFSYDVEKFSDLAWELLGDYINANEHLVEIDLAKCRLGDSNISLLFKNWITAKSLQTLQLWGNNFGMDGIRSMVPYLKNSRNLSKLSFGDNRNINTECFRLAVEGLHGAGGSIETLNLGGCNIEDIMALEHLTLPRLRILDLDLNNIQSLPTSLENYTNLEELLLEDNKVGGEGCRSIAKLLEKEGSRLRLLALESNNVGDEEAEILADSLQHNTSLETLNLCENNDITEKGLRAFLKLLNDVSSIKSTCNSNHTLTTLALPESTNSSTVQAIRRHIDGALAINESNEGNAHAAGGAKVIDTQLNSQTRKGLSRLQGIDCSCSSIFGEIDPLVLPEVLALVGGKHGQRELYRMLIGTTPYLASIIDREAIVKQQISEKSARIAALTAEVLELNMELASIESAKTTRQPMIDDENESAGRKRERDN